MGVRALGQAYVADVGRKGGEGRDQWIFLNVLIGFYYHKTDYRISEHNVKIMMKKI